jgi:DmsE family decaheme c-type cytochrome
MSRYIPRSGPKVLWACGLGLWLFAVIGVRVVTTAEVVGAPVTVEKTAAPSNVPQPDPLPVPQQSAMAASSAPIDQEICLTCHTKAGSDAFTHSKHGELSQSCANCHSNASEHAKAQTEGRSDGPVPSLKKLTVNETNAVCLNCHEKANQASFLSSMHASKNVACTTCHSVHDYKSANAQLKTKTDTETCVTCHKAERSEMNKTSHHPVREGKMGCSSCHNPHDGTRPKMIKAESVNELCYQCHTEKRGPFLFEHAPVREDCVSCHQPHGSNHKSMLTSKMPNLCWNCHSTGSGHFGSGDNNSTQAGVRIAPPGAPAGFPTVNNRFIERGCTKCHLNIHGSNSPSGAYFVR